MKLPSNRKCSSIESLEHSKAGHRQILWLQEENLSDSSTSASNAGEESLNVTM